MFFCPNTHRVCHDRRIPDYPSSGCLQSPYRSLVFVVRHRTRVPVPFEQMDDDGNDILTFDSLVLLLSYLPVSDLLNASLVKKAWNAAANTPSLWRCACRRRWMFFNSRAVGGSASWKEYFLWRDTLEKGMASGTPGADFKCKSLRGHAGKIVGLCYVGQRQVDVQPGELRSLVCSVSTDKTLRVWDAHEGTCLWRSPEQAAELTAVVSVPSLCLLASGNRSGHVSLWAVENGQCMASQSNPTPGVTSIVSIEDKFPSILIGDWMGKLHVLSLPDLERKHSATVFSDVRIDHLGLSSDKTLVSVASKEDLSGSPLMIYPTEQLLHPPEDPREAVKLPFPAASFLAACWLPLKPARLAALLRDGVTERVNIWDLQLKKDKYSTNINVADVGNITPMNSFPRGLLSCWGESVVFTASMNTLQMWNVFGKALSTFTHHREAITDIHVDGVRVVTCAEDLSLHVYTWDEVQGGPVTLSSRYSLLGGSKTMSRAFTKVVCDYSSIVGVVEGLDGKDVLKAYSFQI